MESLSRVETTTSDSINDSASCISCYRSIRQRKFSKTECISIWLIIWSSINIILCRCIGAFQSIVDLLFGIVAVCVCAPYLLIITWKDGLGGFTIPTFVEVSQTVPFFGQRFLSFLISLHSPFSSNISPRVETYYLASDDDEDSYSCEVEVSMADDRSIRNAFNR